MLDSVLTQFREMHVADVVDIALVTTFFYSFVVLVRRTRARLVAIGMLFLGALYVAAIALDLRLTTWLLQGFFAVFLVILVVIFQEELRQLFERLALWGLRHRSEVPAFEPLEIVVRCVDELARAHVGALIVLVGQQPIVRHLQGGIELDGRLSAPLLHSLFDPHTPGHDGAVVIEGDKVSRFAVQLPLSTDFRQLASVGMRHSAALGLAERTDALCIVVSEERGQISVARDGRLQALPDATALNALVHEFLRAAAPRTPERGVLWSLLRENWVEKIASLALVLGLWYLFVPGSRPATAAYPIEVRVVNVPPGYALEAVDPPQVTAIFSGARRAFYLFDPRNIDVTVDATLAKYGRRTFPISEEQIRHPPDLTVDDVRPDQIRISLRSTGALSNSEAEAADRPPAGAGRN